MKEKQAGNEMREEARYNARMRAALLEANEALRKENAHLKGVIDFYRVDQAQDKLGVQAWSMTAAAADGGLGIYGQVCGEVRVLLLHKKVTEAYDVARRTYELTRHEQAMEIARRMRVTEHAAVAADPARSVQGGAA